MSTSKSKNNHNNTHDLKELQYNDLYKNNDRPLNDLRKQHKSFVLWVCAGLFVLALILAITLKIPNYVTIPVVIENQGETREMSFSHDVRVLKNYIGLGDSIVVGDQLCLITSPEIKSLISQIVKAEQKLQSLVQLDSIQLESTLLGLQEEQTAKYALIKAIQTERKAALSAFKSEQLALKASADYTTILFQKNHTLYRKGVISQVEFLTVKRNYQQVLAQRDVLMKNHLQNMQSYELQIERINESLVPIRNQETATTLNYEIKIKKLYQAIEIARHELELQYGNVEIDGNSLILKAQKDGVITYRSSGQSRLISGQILYRAEYSREKLFAKGFLNSEIIGQIETNMIGKINFESLPSYQWGILKGRIHTISLSTDNEGRYAFTATIKNTNPKVYRRLRNGQSGNMSVIIDSKTLIGYLTVSFKKNTSML
ncbi:hypothetical protein [Kordia sp.]|uniref:hypothetical protein n=1 Tax=Kordia sp. TaxID=1965332 RepID=UPI003D276841